MKTKILEALENMNADELIAIHNNYCTEVNAFDDEIYSVDEIDEVMCGYDAWWIICRAYYGEFYPNCPYFKFDGYGNLQSIYEYEITSYVYIEDIADYIIENNDSLYNDDIQEILDNFIEIEPEDAEDDIE